MKLHFTIIIAFALLLSACKTAKDLTANLPTPRDQGNESSVVGFAVAAALEHAIYSKEGKKVVISPRYIFNQINNAENQGAVISDALDLLIEKGAVEESAWPYLPGEYAKPVPENSQKAFHYKIKDYFQIYDLSNSNTNITRVFQKRLNGNQIIIAGILVYKDLYNTGKNGIYAPNTTGNREGGHAIAFVGYDDKKQLFKFRNSWGNTWGDGGYGYISYTDLPKVLKYAYVFTY